MFQRAQRLLPDHRRHAGHAAAPQVDHSDDGHVPGPEQAQHRRALHAPDPQRRRAQAARLQEDPAGAHLPHLADDTARLRDGQLHAPDLLLRVPGPALGPGQTGPQVQGVRREVPREVQGPAERGLSAAAGAEEL